MVVWGTRSRVQQLMTVSMNCKNCQRVTVHGLRRAQKKFTLYFVPLAPLSTRHYLQCNICGAASEITKEHVAQLQERKEMDQSANLASGPLPGDAPL
jgi:zinc ribbon protein